MTAFKRNGVAAVLDAEETTPLLHDAQPSPADAGEDGTTTGGPAAPPGKPLPRMQMFLLCYARMMEPIAFFSIFPYIAAMVQRAGRLPESDVGFYSGLIESLFSITQTLVLIFWGQLADRVGRKPVLIWSMVGMCAGPALFGLATTLPQMILYRCLAGVFSGSTLIIRTMVFDHCTPETQAKAFSWFAFSGNMGIFLGPIIGGFLADPATQYPGFFGGIKFFEHYPYALPGFAVSLIAASGVVTSIFFLEETLNKDADKKPAAATAGKDAASKHSVREILRTPGMPMVLFLNGSVMLMAFAFTALLPVVLYTSVELGGLGLTASQISIYMAIQGASQAFWLLVVFPPLYKRIGNRNLLTCCCIAYPIFFLNYMLLNTLLRVDTPTAWVWVWIVGPSAAVLGPGVSMAFTCVQLALNDASPDPTIMGTLNGIALTISSALRSFTPGLVTVVYAIGVRDQILWGYLAWVVLIPASMLMMIAIPHVRDAQRPEVPAAEEEADAQ